MLAPPLPWSHRAAWRSPIRIFAGDLSSRALMPEHANLSINLASGSESATEEACLVIDPLPAEAIFIQAALGVHSAGLVDQQARRPRKSVGVPQTLYVSVQRLNQAVADWNSTIRK